MHLNRTLASALSLTALLGTACSDSTLVEPSARELEPTLSASAPYGFDESEVRLSAGDTHQMAVAKPANGKDAPSVSVTWSSDAPAVATVSPTGMVTAIAPGEAIVSASRGVHRQDIRVIVGDGCTLQQLPTGSIGARISAADCALEGRFGDIYAVDLGMGEVVRFEAAGITGGRQGIKVPGATLPEGVFQNVPMGAGIRVIGNGNPFHAVAASSTFGGYTMSRNTPSEAHDCDDYNFLLPGSSFATSLTPANSCAVAVAFPSIPQAMGMPLNTHYYNMYVEGGKTYTVTITGVSDSFNPALTVFAGKVFQSAPDGNPAPSTRTVTFSRPTSNFVGIEVATGRFVGGLQPENWVIETGAYTMTVSQ